MSSPGLHEVFSKHLEAGCLDKAVMERRLCAAYGRPFYAVPFYLFITLAFWRIIMAVTVKPFGRFWNQDVNATVLSNKNGMEVEVLDYGCIMRRLVVPSKNGPADIVLGFDNLAQYLYGHPCYGILAGRVANRIHNGEFVLNGKTYHLPCNEGVTGQHLHGGVRGFDKYVWSSEAEEKDGVSRVVLRRTSEDGEQGYPGAVDVVAEFCLDEDNGVSMNFTATAKDQDTIVNLANHNYYNLAGHGSPSIEDHELHLYADAYTPVQSNMIPTGEIRPVSKDPAYDFTSMKRIGDQMAMPGLPDRMFDVNYVLNGTPSSEPGLILAAEVRDPASGRTMTVSTDLPGIQFYNASKLSLRHWDGKDGMVYQAFNSLCLETQFFPDAPNHPNFPSIVLKAGETRTTHTTHRFSW